MDLINWSLSAIDTIFSTRKLGSGEPVCPDGTFAAGYTMDAWERWQIVCLAALSVEDIEDIYLFGTMITGLLLIGLGFALGYRKIQKTGTAVQSLTRLPAMTEAVGRAVNIATETINRNMDSIKTINRNMDCILEKITVHSRPEWTDRVAALECGYSPKQIAILSFGSPVSALPGKVVVGYLSLGKNTAAGRSRSLPYHRHYSPPPTKLPLNALYRHLSSRSVTGAANGTGPDGCLPELDMFPPVASCVYGICAFVLRCFFFCSHTVLPMEHSLGVKKFFSPPSPYVNAVLFFHSLSSCSVYPVVICMLCMYGQVDG